jgi:branched-subunit amino acid transport protein AzlD
LDSAVIGNGISIVAALAAATVITRFLPFLLFPAGKKIPRYMEYLGKTLPYATIGLLVVYCLKDVRISGAAHGLPELIAVTAIVVLHWRKGNSLLSIGVGTVLYMVLVQRIFV